MLKIFKRRKESIKKYNPMSDNRKVLVDCQWIDRRCRQLEEMTKARLYRAVEEGLIFEDFEIIAYL